MKNECTSAARVEDRDRPWASKAAVLFLATAGILLAAENAWAAGAPATTNAPAPPQPRTNYSSFKIVTERNIFNANRSGRSSGAP
jgi:hypothetical protein